MTDNMKNEQAKDLDQAPVTEEAIPQPVEEQVGAQETETADKKGKKAKKEKVKLPLWAEILSWMFTLLSAVLIAGLIRFFLFEPVQVQGRSMQDTLMDKQIVIVTKPKLLMGNINRGDVVICRFPNREAETTIPLGASHDLKWVAHTVFIKRLVALPGDAVEIKEGQLFVNDLPVDEPYVAHKSLETMPRFVLGEGQYFVCGDNRANSNDSRSVGPITRDMIVGHAKFVLFPLGDMKVIK